MAPLFSRNKRSFPVEKIRGFLTKKLLQSISSTAKRERGFPIAVFANDWIGTTVYVDGIYEKDHIEDFVNIASELFPNLTERMAVDIGANIGNHTLQFSKYFGKVLSFEPNPRTFKVLDANTTQLGNTAIFNLGCGRAKQTMTLREDINNFGASSAVLDIETSHKTDINIAPLDDFFDQFHKLAVIKIDVEGMEIDVLKGAEKTITTYHPIICFEQHLTEFTGDCRETESIDWLRERGYRMLALQNKPKRNQIVDIVWKILESAWGSKRSIVEYKPFPPSDYSMIYAIPDSLLRS